MAIILCMFPVRVCVDHCVFQYEVMYMCLYMCVCVCRCCWSLRGRPLRRMSYWLSMRLKWVQRARYGPLISPSHLTCTRSAWTTVREKDTRTHTKCDQAFGVWSTSCCFRDAVALILVCMCFRWAKSATSSNYLFRQAWICSIESGVQQSKHEHFVYQTLYKGLS